MVASAIWLPSYKSHCPPSRQGAYQRASYKPGPLSVLRVLKVVSQVASYALRHLSIVRALLGGVSIAVVAQQHDTSVRGIEAHYGKFILDFSDAISRRFLLDTASSVGGDNVVPLPRGRPRIDERKEARPAAEP